MANKIALKGFGRLSLFPIVKNDAQNYEVGAPVLVPHAQEMTREADAKETMIYADDCIYLQNKNFGGTKVSITLAEMDLKLLETLGFGSFDEATNTLSHNPQGCNKAFGVTFRCLRADGNYRMFSQYVFVVSEVKESSFATKGMSDAISTYQIVGMFTARVKDGKMGEIHDGSDMEWLDSLE